MQNGLELAAVQVPPGPLLVVVVKPARRFALRARPRLAVDVIGVDINPVLLHVQLDAGDRPRRFQSQDRPIKLRFSHEAIVVATPARPRNA